MKRHLGITGLTATFGMWSLANVFTAIAFLGISGVLFQSILLFAGFVAIAKWKRHIFTLNECKQVFPHAFFRMIGLCLLTISLLYVKVGVVDTIIACDVLVMIFILAPLAGEKFKLAMLLPLGTSIVGVAMICMKADSSSKYNFDLTLILPIGAMVALAMTIFLWRKCSENITPTKYLAYMHGWVSLMCVPLFVVVGFIGLTSIDFSPSWTQLGFISLAMIAGNSGDLFFSCSQKFSLRAILQNALIAPSAAVFSSFFGWLIAGQALSFMQVSGMLIVVLSVGIASWMNATKVGTVVLQNKISKISTEIAVRTPEAV